MREVCARSCVRGGECVRDDDVVSRPTVAPSRGAEQHTSLALINISPPVLRMWSLTPPQMNAPSIDGIVVPLCLDVCWVEPATVTELSRTFFEIWKSQKLRIVAIV